MRPLLCVLCDRGSILIPPACLALHNTKALSSRAVTLGAHGVHFVTQMWMLFSQELQLDHVAQTYDVMHA